MIYLEPLRMKQDDYFACDTLAQTGSWKKIVAHLQKSGYNDTDVRTLIDYYAHLYLGDKDVLEQIRRK